MHNCRKSNQNELFIYIFTDFLELLWFLFLDFKIFQKKTSIATNDIKLLAVKFGYLSFFEYCKYKKANHFQLS